MPNGLVALGADQGRTPELLQFRSTANKGFRPRSNYQNEEQDEGKRLLPSNSRDTAGGDQKFPRNSRVRRKNG
ncbi:hypothetical protein ACFX13_010338 [Malus domestica]